MSYTLTIHCGCSVYVACDPLTHAAHTRVIETRGLSCHVRRHEIGLRLYLWELLPDPPTLTRLSRTPMTHRAASDGRRKAS